MSSASVDDDKERGALVSSKDVPHGLNSDVQQQASSEDKNEPLPTKKPRSSLSDRAPGAVRIRGPEYSAEGSTEMDVIDPQTSPIDDDDEPAETDSTAMVTVHAEKVDDDELEAQIRKKIALETVEAKVVDSQNPNRTRWIILSVVCLLVIIGAIIAAVVVATSNNTPSSSSNDTGMEPSLVPSPVPSVQASSVPSFLPSSAPSFSPLALEIWDILLENAPDDGVALQHTDSPQFRAYLWSIADNQNRPGGGLSPSLIQRYALATIYFATGGDNWVQSTNWLTHDKSECTWWSHRVSSENGMCGQSGNVFYFDLHSNNLMYALPPELSLLTQVQELVLYDNSLGGGLPDLSPMFLLSRVDLSRNSITGVLDLHTDGDNSTLSTLRELRLNSNDLSSSLPPEIGYLTSLVALDLGNNLLQGNFPSDEVSKLTKLEELVLERNSFSGNLTESFWESLTNMEVLKLKNSGLGGSISPSIGTWEALTILDLQYDTRENSGRPNQFYGEFPTELENCQSLTELLFQSNQFTGTFPEFLTRMANLEIFDGSGNQINSTLPSSIANMTRLKIFDMQSNELSGRLPTEIGEMDTLLEFKVGTNQLTGPLPTEIGQLPQLTRLFVNSNLLTGQIPTQIGFMKALSSFVIHTNLFSGNLPTQIGELSLRMIQFQNLPLLGGPLPTEIGRLTNMFRLRITETQMTGPLPEELGRLTGVRQFKVQHNAFSGPLPSSLSNMTSLSEFSVFNNSFSGPIPSSLLELDFLMDASFGLNQFNGSMPFCTESNDGMSWETKLAVLVADCPVEVDCPCCSHCCESESCPDAPEVAGNAAPPWSPV